MVNTFEETSSYWRRNVIISAIGALTTIVGMTLLLPVLPIFIAEIGVSGEKNIAGWSGIAYAATFFSAALVAPLWGKLGDYYGRKLMLVRAALGMAIAIGLMGFVANIWQLVGLRLLTGLAGGYASGATILAATQAPKEKTGWALGVISSAVMAGSFVGPMIGGILPQYIGIRYCFLVVGSVIFLTFILTLVFIREDRVLFSKRRNTEAKISIWQIDVFNKPIGFILITGALITFANLSIEPVITIYIGTLHVEPAHLTFWAGLVMSLTALGSAFSSIYLGKLADRIGHWHVLIASMVGCICLLLPQAFVTAAWQLALLRFILGFFLGGLIPCVTAIIRQNVPSHAIGAILGLSVSVQYIGQVLGPICGGFVSGWFGVPSVFFMTAIIMLLALLLNIALSRKIK